MDNFTTEDKGAYSIITTSEVIIQDFNQAKEYVSGAFKMAKNQSHNHIVFSEEKVIFKLSEIAMYELASFLTLELEDFRHYSLIWLPSSENYTSMKILEMLFPKIGITGKVCKSMEEALNTVSELLSGNQ
ncbi:MAG: hypothetical protein ACI9U0_000158 [Flavobacteriales bacterium]|jgi:hypothetical protein|tara:strand:+ start:3241 stop:3630 length:390 start_codon:yes stop_codon:yes gene_type:complete